MLTLLKLIEKAKLWYFLLPLGVVFLFAVTSTGSTSSTALEPSYSQSLTATAVGYEIAAHYSHALPTQASAHKLTATPTNTATATFTPTPTATNTPTSTPTPSDTPTPTATLTPSSTPTPSLTPTAVPTNTPMPTATPSPSPTRQPFAVRFGGDVDLGAVVASPLFIYPSGGMIFLGLGLFWYAGRMGTPRPAISRTQTRPSLAHAVAKTINGAAHAGTGLLRQAQDLIPQSTEGKPAMAHAGSYSASQAPARPSTRRPPNTMPQRPNPEVTANPAPIPAVPAAHCGKYPKAPAPRRPSPSPTPLRNGGLTRPIVKRPGENGTERITQLVNDFERRRANNGRPDVSGGGWTSPDTSGHTSSPALLGGGEGLIVVHSTFRLDKQSATVGTITYDGEQWAWPMRLPLSSKQEAFLYALYLKEGSIGRTCAAAFALAGNGSEASKVTRQVVNYYKELSANERVVLN